jgi:hypothetical protein
MLKRFHGDENYFSDVSDPKTLANTLERYMTAIYEPEIVIRPDGVFSSHSELGDK